MATNRPDENQEDEPRPKGKKKRKPKNDGRRPVLPLLLLGAAVLSFLLVGTIVLVLALSNSHRERGPGAGPDVGPAAGLKAGPGADLVVNGSFEDGPEPDPASLGFTMLETGSTVIRGWTVTRGTIDYIGPYWQHADGRRSLDLNGDQPGAIAQTIRTKPGQIYRVTFSMAGNACGEDGPPIKVLVVNAAGKRAEFTFDTTGRNYADMGWVTKTWEFTATAAETTLEFASATELPAACGPALDRVSVVEVRN